MVALLLWIVLGLVGLVVGSDLVVRSARHFARRIGVSDLVVGLTVTSIGTSLPELATTLTGAATAAGGGPDTAAGVALGNVFGSNLFLLGALLGLSGVVHGLRLERGPWRRDGGVLAAATVLVGLACVGGRIGRVEGAALVIGFLAYTTWLLVTEREVDALDEAESVPSPLTVALGGPVLLHELAGFVAGLVALWIGADLVVDRGVSLAEEVGIAGTAVGVMVGVGTSLPELVVSLQAARSGGQDVAVGNILGSGITNLLLAVGLGGLVSTLAVTDAAWTFDFPFLLAMTVAALALLYENRDLTRAEGIALLAFFGLYVYLRFSVPG